MCHEPLIDDSHTFGRVSSSSEIINGESLREGVFEVRLE